MPNAAASATTATSVAASSDTEAQRAQLQATLQELCLQVSRAALRADDLPRMHRGDKAIYEFLSKYFTDLSERQAHEDAVTIGDKDVEYVLHDVYGTAALSASTAADRLKLAQLHQPQPQNDEEYALMHRAVTDTGSGPFVSQRALRTQLQQRGVNVAGIGEAIELCRYLDDKQGAAVPVGQVNLTHFAAVFVTMMPVPQLSDLIAAVFAALPPTAGPTKGPGGRPGSARGRPEYRAADLHKIRLFHCWSVIDAANRDALQRIVKELIMTPNLTMPLLLDRHPAARAVHTPAYASALGAEGGTTTVAEHREDAEPMAFGAPGGGGPVVAAHDPDEVPDSAGGAADDDGDDDDEKPPPEATAFWANLVS